MGVAHHPEEGVKGAGRADCRIRPVCRWWSHPYSPHGPSWPNLIPPQRTSRLESLTQGTSGDAPACLGLGFCLHGNFLRETGDVFAGAPVSSHPRRLPSAHCSPSSQSLTHGVICDGCPGNFVEAGKSERRSGAADHSQVRRHNEAEPAIGLSPPIRDG